MNWRRGSEITSAKIAAVTAVAVVADSSQSGPEISFTNVSAFSSLTLTTHSHTHRTMAALAALSEQLTKDDFTSIPIMYEVP